MNSSFSGLMAVDKQHCFILPPSGLDFDDVCQQSRDLGVEIQDVEQDFMVKRQNMRGVEQTSRTLNRLQLDWTFRLSFEQASSDHAHQTR